jgi:hypothetical protein
MDLYFYLDTYVGEYLINFYMISFKLLDLDSVEITDFYGSKLISNVLDWDRKRRREKKEKKEKKKAKKEKK